MILYMELKIQTINGGHFEFNAFQYILKKTFPEYVVKNRFSSEIYDRKVVVSLSFSWDFKGIHEKGITTYCLDNNFDNNLVLFFTGEHWDIDCVAKNDGDKYILFTPYRECEGDNMFFMPWIVIIFIQFSLCNYVYKFQSNKNSKRSYFIAYCATAIRKERTQFMNMLVEKHLLTNNEREIHSLGKQHIEGTQHKVLSKFTSPNTALVDEFSKYQFAVVFENQEKRGYITEKLLQAFIGNTIPIYFGDHVLAKQLFNPNAFICVRDFESYDDCIDYIINMSSEKIEEMLDEPMFKDNLVPEMFDVHNFDTGYFGKLKEMIRNKY